MRHLSAIVLLLAVLTTTHAEDWPGWRGPRGDGTSKSEKVPLDFGKAKNVRWVADILGVGHSSPIVSAGKVFLTSCIEGEEKRLLVCLDARTGKELWRREVTRAELEKKHSLNSHASGTPACDGERVYVAFKAGKEMLAACYTVEGKEIWRKSPGQHHSVHGFCTSPVLHKGLVILNGDQDARAFLVAYDKLTGEEKWRADRPNRKRSYCTPILIPDPVRAGRTQLVLSGSKCVTGYDADTGKLLWIHDGPTEQYVASLVLHREVLFLTTGFPERHLMGLRADGEGRINKTKHVVWHVGHEANSGQGAAYVPSPIAQDGLFFCVSDEGWMTCVEAETGKRVWKERLSREQHWASPVLARGHILVADKAGKVRVVPAGRTFQVARVIDMGGPIFASPAIAGDDLLLRVGGKLYCLAER
jgi:outer membrane protein assembly factor BamB